jgi:hypothetical protein
MFQTRVVRHGNNTGKNVRNRPHVCNISLLTVNSVSHQCIGLSAAHILVNFGAVAHGALGAPAQCDYCNRYNSKGAIAYSLESNNTLFRKRNYRIQFIGPTM